ncbi:DUF4350 domain-containing protein [Paenibacillus thermotolerans]|uniref:DUF4350 domain-containing protein n=1 Tax=Paenibacillus thermotolerans TaxID=3027807 RepID=UPI002367B17B|nr:MULTISPECIES: DUF4350 domain-containing protein [unclassified Paenibacillus]
MTRTNRTQALLAVCVFLFIGLGFAFIRPGLTDYSPYLSFSPDLDGTKALRTLLERQGADVREWRLPPDRLPKAEGQLYVAIDPYKMTQTAGGELTSWASEYGNDVVVLEHVPGPLNPWGTEDSERTGDEEKQPAKAEPVRQDESAAYVTAVGGAGETTHEAIVESFLRLTEVEADEVLLRDERGVIAARKSIGQGSVTMALTPEWTQNENILKGEQFELLWSMLGGESAAGRTIYFDEYHHGYADSPGISQVYPPWLLAAFGQIAAALIIWLWRKGKRFGPAYTPREFRVRRSDETLLAVSGWYRRGKLTRESLGYRVEHLKRALSLRGVGLPGAAKAADIAAAAKPALKPETAEALRNVLLRWEQADGAYSEKRWVEDSAVLDEALRTIEGER